MGRRQKEWAKRARLALVIQLGGKCDECGSINLDTLQLDHIYTKSYEPQKLGSDSRIANYRREAKAGLLRVLCKSCNSSRGRSLAKPPALMTSQEIMESPGAIQIEIRSITSLNGFKRVVVT